MLGWKFSNHILLWLSLYKSVVYKKKTFTAEPKLLSPSGKLQLFLGERRKNRRTSRDRKLLDNWWHQASLDCVHCTDAPSSGSTGHHFYTSQYFQTYQAKYLAYLFVLDAYARINQHQHPQMTTYRIDVIYIQV